MLTKLDATRLLRAAIGSAINERTNLGRLPLQAGAGAPPSGLEASRPLQRSLYMGATAASEEPFGAVAAVGIVAEDRSARIRLAGALSGEPNLSVRAATSARALIAAGDANDLLVLHLISVDEAELGLIAALKRDAADLLIVAVCESTDRRSARRVVDAAVDGLVFIGNVDATLVPTVAAVLAGQTAIPRTLQTRARAQSLSVREKQVLAMVVMGCSNGEIAARLFLAESTVKSHLNGAFRKLGVRSRSEAASLILDPHGSLGPGILAITRRA